MLRSFATRLANFAFPFVLAAAAGTVAAQTLSFGNSPGEAGTLTFSGVPASLQTGTPIYLSDYSGGYFDFSFQTGATADGWTFAPGGTVSMVVGAGFNNGIDLNGDNAPDILPGTTLFTGVLGQTTIYDQWCTPKCTGSDFNISASFTVSNLHSGYAAALGVPTGSYTGSFLLGVDFWNGGAIASWNNPSYPGATVANVRWREVTLTLDQQTAPIPEPETYAMMLAGLGLLGFAARRRKQNPNT